MTTNKNIEIVNELEKLLNESSFNSNDIATNEYMVVNILKNQFEWQLKSTIDKYKYWKGFTYRRSKNETAINSDLYLTAKEAILIYELCENIETTYLENSLLINDKYLFFQLKLVCECLKIILFQYSNFANMNTMLLEILSGTIKSIISRSEAISINTDELIVLDESIASFQKKVVIYSQNKKIFFD